MDFQSLARKDLQTLCKRNNIPANKTNVAMADALQALQHVEGLEELLNPSESQNPWATEKPDIGSPEIPKTATRTSTRRKPIKAAEEPESSQTLIRTRRGTRRITEELDQENSQSPQTPAVPSSRKRAPVASARQRTNTEQCSVQHSYGTRRSVRLAEKMGRTEPIHIEFSRALHKDLDGDEEESKGYNLQTISEERSTITNDAEVVSDKKSDQSENDCKAEVEEIVEVSARPDVTDSIKVSEATDEAHGDEESKEVLQKNTVVDSEKRAESVAEKGTDISSMTMLITKNSNEVMKMKESDLVLDLTALPQAPDDDSCCDFEKPDLIFTASGGGVVCKSSVGMDPEKNVASEGAEPDDDEDRQVGSEEFGMGLNQKTADAFFSGLDADNSVSVYRSEAAEVELEYAKQGSIDFKDDASPPSKYNQGDGKEVDKDLNKKTTEIFSSKLGTVADQSEAQVELEFSEQGNKDFEVDSSPPSTYGKGEITDSFFSELDAGFFDADQSEQVELECSKQRSMDFEDDAEEFDMDLYQKTTDAFSSELGAECSIVDKSGAQVELEFTKDGSIDFGDIASSLSITDPKLETEERVNEINSVEPLPKGDKVSFVSAAEKHATADNFPSPVKIMSPRFWVTNAIVSGRTPLSPLVTSRSTPTRKSSNNRPSALFFDNKENLDSGKKMRPKTEMAKKKNSRDTAEDIILKKLNGTSLRQLRKMFKEKLQIKENAHNEDMNVVSSSVEEEVVKMRPALQTLPENRTADDE